MNISSELLKYVRQMQSCADKVRSAREAFYTGRISMSEYVTTLNICNAALEDMKKALQ